MHARKIPNIKHIDDILRAKNLAPDLFSGQLALKADIHLHAAWAYRNIYSVKYNNHQGQHSLHASGIARYSHGIMHTASTAIYVPALVNLYRRYHDMEAIELSDEDIKLLQIAALWHDAAREDDGEDKWDHESALMLYFSEKY